MRRAKMDKKMFDYYSVIGKALSNQNRLEVLDLLLQSKKTVETLANNTGLSVANVSKHLQVLLKAQIVCNEKYKNYIYYQIAGPEMEALLIHYFEVAYRQFEQQKKIVEKFLTSDMKSEPITLEEMENKMAKKEICLIDVRPSEEYENEHIPGAMSMPVEELEKQVKNLPKNQTIVAYCRGPHCLLSQEALEILEKNGRSAVRLMQSVIDWKKYKKETTK